MTDDLLTEFRSSVPLADEATARRIYGRATSGRRRRPRRRHVVAIALVSVAGIAAGLAATNRGEGSKPIRERKQIVHDALMQTQRAFGDGRILDASLSPRGSLLTVRVKYGGAHNSVIGPEEGAILAQVVDDQLRASGYDGVAALKISGKGTAEFRPAPAQSKLPAGACHIPAGTHLDGIASASGRLIPLLGGFCSFRLTFADLPTFSGAVTALRELRVAVPAGNRRPAIFELDDWHGNPAVIYGENPGDQGGATYVAPGLGAPPI